MASTTVSPVVVGMRDRSLLLAALMGLMVASTAFSTVFAGTKSSPDIQDDTGDWRADPDPGVISGNTSNAVSDSIDVDGVWFQFTSKRNLQVGVSVVDLADTSTNNQSSGSLEYTFEFSYSRPALPGAEPQNVSGITVTISTNLNPEHVPDCDGGDNASKFPGEDHLVCNIPSSNVAPEYEGNTTFYDGDAITAGSISTSGQADDGQITYSDSASGLQEDVVVDGIQEPPEGTESDDGGGTGDAGNGTGTGGGGDGGGESTPGFGPVVAAASLVGVALWAARRRD